ncbi:MAG: GntR family transcriptional regulator [Holophaga sp.]|nr:GntR family transcriptional regulator [Holophaga sp.]
MGSTWAKAANGAPSLSNCLPARYHWTGKKREAFLSEGPVISTTVEKVVVALRQAMFDGNLNPGARLREEMLSQRFGVSRSTIREALRVLTMDGLVTRMPKRSVIVHHLTVAEVEDIFRARILLEGASVRAAATCSDQTLEDLRRALDRYVSEVVTHDAPRAAEAHVEFHATMVHLLSQSQWLAETERSMMRHLLLIIASVHMSPEDLNAEIEQHRVLCDLCIARRIDDALVRLEEDLMSAKAFAVRFTYEALNVVKHKDKSPWLDKNVIGVSLRATASS